MDGKQSHKGNKREHKSTQSGRTFGRRQIEEERVVEVRLAGAEGGSRAAALAAEGQMEHESGLARRRQGRRAAGRRVGVQLELMLQVVEERAPAEHFDAEVPPGRVELKRFGWLGQASRDARRGHRRRGTGVRRDWPVGLDLLECEDRVAQLRHELLHESLLAKSG